MQASTEAEFQSLRDLVLHYGRRRGWTTQRHIAIECEIDETGLSRFLNGEQDPGASRTFQIFRQLGVPLEQLDHAFALLDDAQAAARRLKQDRRSAFRRATTQLAPRVAVVAAVAALGIAIFLGTRPQSSSDSSSRQTSTGVAGAPPAATPGGPIAAPVPGTGVQPGAQPGFQRPTPEPPPGPSPIAPPGPTSRVIQSDSFADPVAGILPRAARDPLRFRTEYDAGEYLVAALPATDGEPVAVALPGQYGDATIAVNVRLEEGSAGGYAFLLCRDSATAGYQLTLDPERGDFTLVRWDGNRSTVLLRGGGVRSGSASNRAELSCIGSTIGVRLNGQDAGSVQDSTHTQGRLLLGAGVRRDRLPGSVTARFANLVVTAP